MKRLISCAIVLALFAAVAARPVRAADPPAPGKIRVLVTVGGHAYEEAPFDAMFKALPDITFTKIELPKQADMLKPGLEKDYDVIVMYDMVGAIGPQQQEAFIALLNKGIGLFSLHHNMGAHQDWDEFHRIIGGKFFTKDGTIDGKPYKTSTWDHDQDLSITVADARHPITRGLKDFTIHDEVYKGYWVSPKVRVLLKTDHPKNSPEIAWVTSFGNSRVFYLMLGHDSQAWKNPNFTELLSRGIRWAATKGPGKGSGRRAKAE
jgi:type 1 glutamine amidotransferase